MFSALNDQNQIVQIEDANREGAYVCPGCGRRVNVRALNSISVHPHFAHEKGCECTYSVNHDMSPWHRAWQNLFAPEFREVKCGEVPNEHRADVCIDNKVIEFQHSPINREVFEERTRFYTGNGYKLVWIFDMTEKINPVKSHNGSIRINRRIDHLDGYDIQKDDYNLFIQVGNALFFVEKVKGNQFLCRKTVQPIFPKDLVSDMTIRNSVIIKTKLMELIKRTYFHFQRWLVNNTPENEARADKLIWIPDSRA